MMQQAYPMMQANPYIRQPYNGAYNNMQRAMDPYQQQQQQQQMYSNQAAYQAPTYNQAGYYQPQPQPQPQQQQYPMANPMYARVAAQDYEVPNYDVSRGRGGAFPGRAGRGGFRGGRGGVNGRKKKPFVGGTLETQKEWERQTACCFFLQDKCKFGDTCRFLHRHDASLSCQFGENCHVHGTKAAEELKQQQQHHQAADASPQLTQENNVHAGQEGSVDAKSNEKVAA